MPDTDSPIHIYRSDAMLSPDAFVKLGGLLAGLDQLDPILSLPVHPAVGELAFGRYKLLSRLGAGRFGVVLLADDPVLGRKVVVKVPQPSVLTDAELRQRFEREARAAARLEHPGIVPILEAGEIGGLPYLVAAFVDGPTLAGWMAEHPGPLAPRTAARLAAAIASALEHAHERGVLHCDLSPSNILLAPESKRDDANDLSFAPLVTDFGLARLLEDDPSTTRTYRVAGTPAYMAPEQARGNRRSLTSRSDVYALGAILYELLTGAVPFRGESSDEVLERLSNTAPASPRRLNPDVPRDLAAICLKCLEREPRDRYGSSAAVAEDLERYLAGRPVAARPIRLAVRGARWVQRHPLGTTSLALAVILTSVAVVMEAEFWAERVKLRAALLISEHDQKEAEAKSQSAEFRSTLDRVRQRRLNRTTGWLAANRTDLARLGRGPVEDSDLPALRTEVASVATSFDLSEPRSVATGFNAQAIGFNSTSSRLAIAELKSDLLGTLTVRILDMPAATDRFELKYSADRFWELRAGRKDGSWSVAFSPDGKWLVVGTRSGGVVVWDLTRMDPTQPARVDPTPTRRWQHGIGKESGSEAARRESVYRLAFDAAGRLWTGNDQDCAAWDPAKNWAEAERHAGFLYRPTGTLAPGVAPARPEIAAAGPGAEWFVRRTQENGLAIVLPDHHPVGRISLVDDARAEDDTITDFAVSPDGILVASAAEFAGHIKLWSVACGRLLASRTLNERSLRLAFSPDSRSLAVIGADRILVYDIVRPAASRVAGMQANPVNDFDLSIDGSRLAIHATIPNRNDAIRLAVRNLKDGVRVFERELPPAQGNSRPRVALHPHGLDAVVHTADRATRFAFDPPETTKLHRPGGTREVRYTRGGRLWAASIDSVHTWSAGQLCSIRTGDITSLAADDSGAVIGLRDGTLVWCSQAGERVRSEKIGESEITGLARSGDRVIAGTGSGEVYMLGSDRKPIPILHAHTDTIWAVALGPRGWFATGSADCEVRIWDEAGQLVLALPQSRPVRRLDWSADGETLTLLAVGERAVRQIRLRELKAAIAEMGFDPRLP